MQCGIFLPVGDIRREEGGCPVQIDTSSPFMLKENAFLNKSAAFFNILTEDSTVGLFIDAIAHSDDGGDPYAFMSKAFAGELDIHALKHMFEDTDSYKCLIKAQFQPTPKNYKTNSVVVFNKERKVNSIVHIHMVNEPDQFGKWKIFGIERE